MKTAEQMQTEHAAELERITRTHERQLAELQMAQTIAAEVGILPRHVMNNTSLEPWVMYKARTLTDALEIIDAWPAGEPGAAVDAGCLYVGPAAKRKAGERGKVRWESSEGLYEAKLSHGKGFSSAELTWYPTRPSGEVVAVKVDVERWPHHAYPECRVTYDSHGDVSRAEHSLPHLGEWQRIKWAGGGRDACMFSLYFSGRRSFRDWLVDLEAAGDFYELTPADVHRPTVRAFKRTWPVSDFIGTVMLRDVGKRVYKRGDILQVENDEQRDMRLAAERERRSA